jgi:hypothetical protein
MSSADGRRSLVLMLLWGAVAGISAALVLLAITPHDWSIVGSRGAELRASMAVLRHGGPLLLGHNSATNTFYMIGTNDEGSFIYFPLLSRFFGLSNPVSVERYLYIALFAVTAAVYPALFYKLTYSALAGLCAPVALLLCARSLGFSDVYWIPAWGALTFLPVLYLLDRDWPAYGLIALVAVSFAAGAVSSLRPDSGVAVVITVAIVLLLRHWRWWQTAPALALVAVAYVAIITFVFPAVRDHRDQRIGVAQTRRLERDAPSPHVWHSMYIGLGYLPNSSHIRYKDGVSAARVQREAPGTRYLSAHYNSVIRKAYFSELSHHPFEVLKQYAAKLLVTAADCTPYLLIILLTMPAMLLVGSGRRSRRRWTLVTLPAIVAAALPAMVAVPVEAYEQGLYGVLGTLGILGFCWAVGELTRQTHASGGLRTVLREPRTLWSGRDGALLQAYRRSLRFSAIALAGLIVLALAGHFVAETAEHWQGQSSSVLLD